MTDDLRRRALTGAVLAVIDELDSADLIVGVTPERIGQRLGYSASSVRYQFSRLFGAESTDQSSGKSTWTFDRSDLWRALIDDIGERVLSTTLTVRDRYLTALDRAAAIGTLAPLSDVVRDDLDAYAPGASDAPTSLSERAYLLAVAASDGAPDLARQLRHIRKRELELYLPIYRRGLELSGRRLRAGLTLLDVAGAVAHLLEGASFARRHSPSSTASDRATAHAMLAIFNGMTEQDPTVHAAPLRNVR